MKDYISTVITILATGLVTAFLMSVGYFIVSNFNAEREMGIQQSKVEVNSERIAELDARVKLIEGKYEELLKLTITIDTKMDLLLKQNNERSN